MKKIGIVAAAFVLAFATSGLLEIRFFSDNPVRYVLVVVLMAVELVVAFYILKSITKNE